MVGFREMNGHSIVTVIVGSVTKNDPESLVWQSINLCIQWQSVAGSVLMFQRTDNLAAKFNEDPGLIDAW